MAASGSSRHKVRCIISQYLLVDSPSGKSIKRAQLLFLLRGCARRAPARCGYTAHCHLADAGRSENACVRACVLRARRKLILQRHFGCILARLRMVSVTRQTGTRSPAVSSLLVTGVVLSALLHSSLACAQEQEQELPASDALPGIYRVGVARTAPAAIAGTLGYGFTEAQNAEDGAQSPDFAASGPRPCPSSVGSAWAP